MPYRDPAQQAAYQRKWIARRRSEYLADKTCAHCGTTDGLNVHHVDPEQKLSHHIWSWSPARRDAELAKCIVLCSHCHQRLHKCRPVEHGTRRTYQNGCRCRPCKDAQRDYFRARRAR